LSGKKFAGIRPTSLNTSVLGLNDADSIHSSGYSMTRPSPTRITCRMNRVPVVPVRSSR